jgi:hypothetical protein
MFPALLLARTSNRNSAPCPASERATWLPTNPVAPVTKAFNDWPQISGARFGATHLNGYVLLCTSKNKAELSSAGWLTSFSHVLLGREALGPDYATVFALLSPAITFA